MRKELIISTIPQETRLALVEDDELVEFLIERHRAQAIIGNIYKGRVTKVLPGMQSAFVDIGLERDAFLYVSDFVEDGEEYERIVSTAEDQALEEPNSPSAPSRTRTRTRRGGEPHPGDARQEKSERPPKASSLKATEPTPPVEPSDAPVRTDAGPTDGARRDLPDEDADARERPAGPRRTERRERRPRVPSFEARPDHSSGGLQVLPGETLAKYKNEPVTSAEEGQPDVAGDVGDDVGAGVDRADTRDAPSADERESEPATPTDASALAGEETSMATDQVRSTARSESADPPEPEAEKAPEVSSEASEGAGNTGASTEPDGDEPARVRMTDPPPSGKFTRKPPARRPRRRQPSKSEDRAGTPASEPKISDLLRAGQEILVQVSKEPLGKKGARITSHIALPGRYLVYMPTVDHVGVSRKISTEDERARLRQIISAHREGLPGGFIVRTAAEGRDEQEFVQDLRFLGDLWKEIREKSEQSSAPAVIHSDLSLIEKFLRDQLTDEFLAIRLDSEVEYARVLEFVSRFQPSLVNRVRLHLKETPILEEYGLQQEIDKAMKPKVWLKSGGYIVVNQTEALVAIDVNTGKFVGKSNRLEDTIVRTNIDAVHEIVRQIRLRNLGGIIVVDFIDMEERKNRQRVMQALEEELRKDKSPSKILQFNDFGLVAITRKRTQPSLEKVLGRPCPRCSGAGFVKALETVCYEIQHEVRKMLSQIEGRELTVRVNPEVAKAIKSGEFVDFTEVEEETRKDIRIKGDPSLEAERFDIF